MDNLKQILFEARYKYENKLSEEVKITGCGWSTLRDYLGGAYNALEEVIKSSNLSDEYNTWLSQKNKEKTHAEK